MRRLNSFYASAVHRPVPKIDGMLYERTAISKKPEELIEKDLMALHVKPLFFSHLQGFFKIS
ncbi:MAG: hypothetical protein J7K15_13075 [Deltaproteobacteria bacterium]|nr:hypothetical protein [Deltaproteobacteria bacterium]